MAARSIGVLSRRDAAWPLLSQMRHFRAEVEKRIIAEFCACEMVDDDVFFFVGHKRTRAVEPSRPSLKRWLAAFGGFRPRDTKRHRRKRRPTYKRTFPKFNNQCLTARKEKKS